MSVRLVRQHTIQAYGSRQCVARQLDFEKPDMLFALIRRQDIP